MMRLYWINFLCDSIKANRLITTRILYLWAMWLLSKERMGQNGITMILMDGSCFAIPQRKDGNYEKFKKVF